MKFKKDALTDLLRQAESQKVFDKAVAGFILPDGSSEVLTLNTPENTVFDIASLTKVCPTSTLALSYILEGKLSVDTKVIDYIPELQTNYREDIRVFHLLTHSLDYRVPMKTLRTLPAEGILNALYTYQFERLPVQTSIMETPPACFLESYCSALWARICSNKAANVSLFRWA